MRAITQKTKRSLVRYIFFVTLILFVVTVLVRETDDTLDLKADSRPNNESDSVPAVCRNTEFLERNGLSSERCTAKFNKLEFTDKDFEYTFTDIVSAFCYETTDTNDSNEQIACFKQFVNLQDECLDQVPERFGSEQFAQFFEELAHCIDEKKQEGQN